MTFAKLLQELTHQALAVDASGAWPTGQMAALAEAGVLKWTIPAEYGGEPRDDWEMAQGYRDLAAACLTTCFILTQRNGACQRIIGSESDSLKASLLPRLATGELFATVGISHLTTSRQHVAQPAVSAEFEGAEILLDGVIPWVTGAAAADLIVTGGTCADGRQVLVALPTDLPGVQVRPHARLMSLTASATTAVELTQVRVSEEMLLAGPVAGVMSQGQGGGTGSLTTSTLAIGVTQRALQFLEQERSRRSDLNADVDRLRHEFDELHADLKRACTGQSAGEERCSAAALRGRANSLVLRCTQAALVVTKGAGFQQGHPVELAVREAMFFLVWSCPQPVASSALHELACRESFH